MCSLEDLHIYFFDIFIRQDYKNEKFDVIFHVDGRELYAHENILSCASPVFKELFKKNRPTLDDPINRPIQIDGYSYDEFREFIRFIYCFGNYDYRPLDGKTIFAIIELSHIYKLDEIKEYLGEELAECDGFESFRYSFELDDEDIKDIFEKIEFANKYSLKRFKRVHTIQEFLAKEISTLIGYNGFINLEKSTVEAMFYFIDHANQTEELCEAIYKWGEYQAMITVEMPEKEKNQLIFHQIKDILPLFRLKLLKEFFANKKGLISIDDAIKFKTIKVSITSNDKTITGTFIDSYGIFECVKFNQNRSLYCHFGTSGMCSFWDYVILHRSSPSTVQKMDAIDWYLLFDDNGYLTLKHRSKIEENDYLIAEMKASNENGEDGESMINGNNNVYAIVSRQI